jgi:hypothetical protein
LNQAQAIIDKPEGHQRSAFNEKPATSLAGNQRAWHRQQHEPVIYANGLGGSAKRKVCEDRSADDQLPRLNPVFYYCI